MCPQGYRDINQENEDEDEEDEEDEENPEDDPDVQNIRWFWCDPDVLRYPLVSMWLLFF